jgi:hypothetical protein
VERETTYTVYEAAAILGETPERVLEMLKMGELDGIAPGATLAGEWKVLLPTSAEESTESAPGDQEETPAASESAEEFVEPPDTPPPDEHEEPLRRAEAPASGQLSRGDNAAADREPAAPSGWVSTQQAARALGISARTVRWHIEQGNLEAKPEGEGVRRSWMVSIDSLQAFRDARQAAGDMPRAHRAPAEAADIAAEGSGEAVRVLAERLEEAAARAAEYRVRLELTAQAESSLKAELEEVRRRRDDLERERDELRRELEALREARPPEPLPEPPPEPPGAPTPAPAAPEREEPSPPTGGPRSTPERPQRRRALWRRMFGG